MTALSRSASRSPSALAGMSVVAFLNTALTTSVAHADELPTYVRACTDMDNRELIAMAHTARLIITALKKEITPTEQSVLDMAPTMPGSNLNGFGSVLGVARNHLQLPVVSNDNNIQTISDLYQQLRMEWADYLNTRRDFCAQPGTVTAITVTLPNQRVALAGSSPYWNSTAAERSDFSK